VDSTFTHVERVLKIFPTRRWGDYRVNLGDVDPDSITLLGEGETYGDEPFGLRCDWNGGAPREFTGRHGTRMRNNSHSLVWTIIRRAARLLS
jgi:hypothetical protein